MRSVEIAACEGPEKRGKPHSSLEHPGVLILAVVLGLKLAKHKNIVGICWNINVERERETMTK